MNKLLIAAVMSCTVLAAQAKDIVDTAVSAGNFKTMAAALGAADLVQTFKGRGPSTVFAPADEVSRRLPRPTWTPRLRTRPSSRPCSPITWTGKVMTVQGSDVTVSTIGGAMVNNAKVVSADVAADNGVIHASDTVPMPK